MKIKMDRRIDPFQPGLDKCSMVGNDPWFCRATLKRALGDPNWCGVILGKRCHAWRCWIGKSPFFVVQGDYCNCSEPHQWYVWTKPEGKKIVGKLVSFVEKHRFPKGKIKKEV